MHLFFYSSDQYFHILLLTKRKLYPSTWLPFSSIHTWKTGKMSSYTNFSFMCFNIFNKYRGFFCVIFFTTNMFFFSKYLFFQKQNNRFVSFTNLANSKRNSHAVLTKLYISKKPTQSSLHLYIKVKKFQREDNVI